MTQNSIDQEWQKLLATVKDLGDWFPDGLVVIGGIAVYQHATKSRPEFAEVSHDGDFFLSLADYADIRDLEEVTPNRRLGKNQIIKNGFESLRGYCGEFSCH